MTEFRFLTDVFPRYLNAEESANVRSVLAELHQLSLGPEGDRAAQLAFDCPQGWVLKPSREGGGNNFFDDDMLEKLRELKGSDKREAYVLMEKLRPPHVPNRFVFILGNTVRRELSPSSCLVGL